MQRWSERKKTAPRTFDPSVSTKVTYADELFGCPRPQLYTKEQKQLERDAAVGLLSINGQCGASVSVYWDGDKVYYNGRIVDHDPTRTDGKYFKVHYQDNEVHWESLKDIIFNN